MRRLLRGCEVVPFDEAAARAAGGLLGKTRTRMSWTLPLRHWQCGRQPMSSATTQKTFGAFYRPHARRSRFSASESGGAEASRVIAARKRRVHRENAVQK